MKTSIISRKYGWYLARVNASIEKFTNIVVTSFKIIKKFNLQPGRYVKISNFKKIQSKIEFLDKFILLPYFKEFIDNFDSNAIIVDVGSSNRRLCNQIVNFDLFPNPNVDIAGDIHNIPLRDNSIDGVIVTGVLEHVEDPITAVKELYRILKEEGRIYASIPFMQGYHPDPTDYQRYTIDGIQKLFKAFKEIEISNTRGSGSTVSWVLTEFFSILLSFNNEKVYQVLRYTLSWLFFPFKYFDDILEDNRFDLNISSGFTYVGRK